MADDPRIEPVAEYICAQFDVSAEDAEMPTLAILGEADAHDPLRALLADEDRALELIMNGISTWTSRYQARRDALSVLAALRGVADHA